MFALRRFFLSCAAVLLFSGLPGAARAETGAGWTYARPLSYLAGSTIGAMTTADFDRNGIQDLAVSTPGKVHPLLGHPDGHFRPSAPLDMGTGPVLVATGDTDGDGRTDLLAVNQDAGSLAAFPGTGDGAFGPKAERALGFSVFSLQAGDLDGDGKADLVMLKNSADVLTADRAVVMMNRGDGTFNDPVEYPVAVRPRGVALGDPNGDGKTDLAVVSEEESTVSVLLNRGDGTFAPRTDYPVGSYAHSVTVYDWNGDAKPDLVATGDPGFTYVLTGTGDGTFGPALQLEVTDPWGIVGDFNGDGRPDLLSPGDSYEEIRFRFGAADGTFTPGPSLTPSSRAREILAGEFGGGSGPDLAVLGYGQFDRQEILLFHPVESRPPLFPPAFAPPTVVNVPTASYFLLEDLNGDGGPDLATSRSGASSLSVALGKGDGTFLPPVAYPGQRPALSVASADFNGDGERDLVSGNDDGSATLFLNNGDGTFLPRPPVAAGNAPVFVAAGDFNRDGKADLAAAQRSSNSVKLLFGDGSGGFTPGPTLPTGPGPYSVTAVDLNGDGGDDLVTANYGRPPTDSSPPLTGNTLSILLGDGRGGFAPAVPYAVPLGPKYAWVGDFNIGPKYVSVGDFNGDGKADLSTSGVGAAADFLYQSLFLGNGDGTLQPARVYHAGTVYDNQSTASLIADVNGDGIPDLAGVNLALGIGEGGLSPESYPGFPGELLRSGDLDGDGKEDVVALGANGLSVRLNRSPALRVTPDREWARSGDRVGYEVYSPRPLEGPLRVTASGPCVEETVLDPPSAPDGRRFAGVYTVPDGTGDCSVILTAQGRRADTGRDVAATGLLNLDRTPPVTTAEIFCHFRTSDGVCVDAVSVFLNAADSNPAGGVSDVYYAVDGPACAPDRLSDCTHQPGSPPNPIQVHLMLTTQGLHTVTYFGRDRFGNWESPRTLTHFLNLQEPAAEDVRVTLAEDTSKEVLLRATDSPGETLTYSIVDGPARGSLGPLAGNAVTYTPAPDFSGSDSFTYKASDGMVDSQTRRVYLTVTPVNDRPTARDADIAVPPDVPTPLRLTAADPDRDRMAWTALTQPEHGSLTFTFPAPVYTPQPGYLGRDWFTFRVNDGEQVSPPALVLLEVTPPLLTLGSAEALPGGTVALPVRLTAAGGSVTGLELRLRVRGPANTSAPFPSYAPGEAARGGQVSYELQDPWRVVLTVPEPLNGPAEILSLRLRIPPNAPGGGAYVLEAESAVLTDGSGRRLEAAAVTLPGRVGLNPCPAQPKGDVNGDGVLDVSDTVGVLRTVVGLEAIPDACAFAAADIDCDGSVLIGDAVALLRTLVLGDPLPPCP